MGLAIRKLFLVASITALVVSLGAAPASAKNTKHTFSDVILTDGDGSQVTGEIEASVKDVKKRTSIYCGYFSDDYQDSLGYYFADSPVADPTESDVLDFCLEEFPDRFN